MSEACPYIFQELLPKETAMISYFTPSNQLAYVVVHTHPFEESEKQKLRWLFECASDFEPLSQLSGLYAGPRVELITPWSTNAVEITSDMYINGVVRIEQLRALTQGQENEYDAMLEQIYSAPGQKIFEALNSLHPEPVKNVEDIATYNEQEGLALNEEEIKLLEELSKRLGRPLTDSELFGFSQVNSEHCRHKIFNGLFVLNGKEQPSSLFKMIKATSQENPNAIVSAYSDNVAFVSGPKVMQFAPCQADRPSLYKETLFESVLSIKAETHNFPTTVEPFNGAATGTGGEIRDRMAGGKGSIPMAGTAVYMTSYPHRENNKLPHTPAARPWLYRSPEEILTKASNGASDFGNKFGQPIITGSLLTFEHEEKSLPYRYGYDKVIMLAGGIGYAKKRDAFKESIHKGETIVVMGGDNYRIGMGGGAVSSVNTGKYSSGIELNAVQRANPEMQKRVQNVVRALAESDNNPILSIHDHGAGGHLNCLTELMEDTGGKIDIDSLPVGDASLSDKEILGNESQERMGLAIHPKDFDKIKQIAERERAPIYKVGETDGSMRLHFSRKNGPVAVDLPIADLLAKTSQTIMRDEKLEISFASPSYNREDPFSYLPQVLALEGVACKDWLTNKVDRSVTGRIARQQTCGELQLPLADLGAIALDYQGVKGMATSIGHAPRAGLICPESGSILSIAEALTNIVFAPLEKGFKSISLSANWMWPCRNKGEDYRLYKAVEAASNFAISLGINIPTGKDSLSMTQKYPDGSSVLSPGTVIISAASEVSDIKQIVSPDLKRADKSYLIHIDFSFCPFSLGGSAFFQSQGYVGSEAPTIVDSEYFADAFNAVQDLIKKGYVLAGHDISDGGLLVTLLEMAFPTVGLTATIDLSHIDEEDLTKVLYSENPGVVLQVKDLNKVKNILTRRGLYYAVIGEVHQGEELLIKKNSFESRLSIAQTRKLWYEASHEMECAQVAKEFADERAKNIFTYPLHLTFPDHFTGKSSSREENTDKPIIAAVIRDKGSNGDRELAQALHRAGFEVKDVHVTDLISGKETLEDVSMIGFCGGFSRSDVLGSAKGWAAAIQYSPKAQEAIRNFYSRPDTLSIGVCNGCQLMALLGVLNEDFKPRHRLLTNSSKKLESIFTSVRIPQNNSVMLHSLEGCELGVWCVHGEGLFDFDEPIENYNVVARYSHDVYPINPNGSPQGVAALASKDGRHLSLMPHPERSCMPWQCGYYPEERKDDEVTPWMEAFENAFIWCKEHKK